MEWRATAIHGWPCSSGKVACAGDPVRDKAAFFRFGFLGCGFRLFLHRLSSFASGEAWREPATARITLRKLAPRKPSNRFRLRISMDRISDSDSEDAGSIPAGATRQERPRNSRSFLFKILLKSLQNEDYFVLTGGSTLAIFYGQIFREN